MPVRGPLIRFLLGLGLAAVLLLALVGGLALSPDAMIAVGLVGGVTACLAGGIAKESARHDRRAMLEAAGRAGAAAITVVLVLSGTAALAGPVIAVLVAGAVVAAGLAVWLVRTHRRPSTGAAPAAASPAPPVTLRSPSMAGRGPSAPLRPVAELSTAALGREWVLSTAALGARLDPATRQAIVARRQQTLDELERRDPAGFARWLAAVPLPGSDPAGHLRYGDPAA
ncbi:hypothetical protein [Geodermatophilus ruber]|uniref:Uncharacterized protein n=1 Tax=Geodermatophilus ruber TaxID=504800 RepID=A0A1I4D3C3_9ACTN|nr:hypothetical protein [Geodermatophilus ruber]SFK88068.1 hypothetical protein SAMN04488085_104166 [Geodermatophilus ruber]